MIKEDQFYYDVKDLSDCECPDVPADKEVLLENCNRLTIAQPLRTNKAFILENCHSIKIIDPLVSCSSLRLKNCSDISFENLELGYHLHIENSKNISFHKINAPYGIEMSNNEDITFNKSIIAFDMRLWGCKNIRLADDTSLEEYLTILPYEGMDKNHNDYIVYSKDILLPKNKLSIGKSLAGDWGKDNTIPPLEGRCVHFLYGENCDKDEWNVIEDHDFLESRFERVSLMSNVYVPTLPDRVFTANKYDVMAGKIIEYNETAYQSFMALNDEIIKKYGHIPEEPTDGYYESYIPR